MSNLSDAITAVETAQTNYSNAANLTTSDVAAVAGIQAKLDAANNTVETDRASQATAAKALNDSLDVLMAAATAAKV